MIASLNGILKGKSPTEVLVDVNGVGYSVSIPLSTYSTLGDLNSPVHLLTHLHVREDAMQLFGFATEAERQLFRLLISITGIGPKIAQGILSGISVPDLRQHIAGGNIAALTSIPGIGKKTAERLIVELRDKIGKIEPSSAAGLISGDRNVEIRSEALLALTSLGYNRIAAEKALRMAINDTAGSQLSVEDLIKKALKYSSG
jgi:holliday junction DNA helicase RuvA